MVLVAFFSLLASSCSVSCSVFDRCSFVFVVGRVEMWGRAGRSQVMTPPGSPGWSI